MNDMRDTLITGIVDLSNGERSYDELVEWATIDLVFEAVGFGMKIDSELAEEYGITLDDLTDPEAEVTVTHRLPNMHIRSQIRPYRVTREQVEAMSFSALFAHLSEMPYDSAIRDCETEAEMRAYLLSTI